VAAHNRRSPERSGMKLSAATDNPAQPEPR
jgi:hypothetical protein